MAKFLKKAGSQGKQTIWSTYVSSPSCTISLALSLTLVLTRTLVLSAGVGAD